MLNQKRKKVMFIIMVVIVIMIRWVTRFYYPQYDALGEKANNCIFLYLIGVSFFDSFFKGLELPVSYLVEMELMSKVSNIPSKWYIELLFLFFVLFVVDLLTTYIVGIIKEHYKM